MERFEYDKLRQRILNEVRIENMTEITGFSFKDSGRYLICKEHDSLVIDKQKNCFHWNSQDIHGSVINFYACFKNIDNKEAFKELASKVQGTDWNRNENVVRKKASVSSKPKEKKPFELPPKGDNNKCVIAYLTKTRCLDKQIVSELLKSKRLYQDDYRNCVFVGYDQNNKAVFGCLRGTSTNKRFIRDLDDNNYKECFYLNNKAKKLIVAESVIDCCSVMTSLKQRGRDYNNYNYLGLSGVGKMESVLHHLKHQEEIDQIIIAFDKDAGGIRANHSLRKKLKKAKFSGTVVSFYPKRKDHNEDLQKVGEKILGFDYAMPLQEKNKIDLVYYKNPEDAKLLMETGLPVGFVIENQECNETFYVPFHQDDIKKTGNKGMNTMETEFANGNAILVHPCYPKEALEQYINTLKSLQKNEHWPEIHQQIKEMKKPVSLETIKICFEKSVLGKLNQLNRSSEEINKIGRFDPVKA